MHFHVVCLGRPSREQVGDIWGTNYRSWRCTCTESPQCLVTITSSHLDICYSWQNELWSNSSLIVLGIFLLEDGHPLCYSLSMTTKHPQSTAEHHPHRYSAWYVWSYHKQVLQWSQPHTDMKWWCVWVGVRVGGWGGDSAEVWKRMLMILHCHLKLELVIVSEVSWWLSFCQPADKKQHNA